MLNRTSGIKRLLNIQTRAGSIWGIRKEEGNADKKSGHGQHIKDEVKLAFVCEQNGAGQPPEERANDQRNTESRAIHGRAFRDLELEAESHNAEADEERNEED